MGGSYVASLVEFRPVVKEEIAWQTDGRVRAHEKKMLLSHILTMRGSDVASLVEIRPVVYEEIAGQTDGRMMDARTDGHMQK